MAVSLVRLHQDFRMTDNPALYEAVRRSEVVIPVFVWAPHEEGEWAPAGAARWWLHRSLAAFAEALRARGSRLIVRQGDALEELRAVVAETGASAVYWNERFTPGGRGADAALRTSLLEAGLDVNVFNARIVHDPDRIRTKKGGPYQVFTPFWNKLRESLGDVRPLPAAPLNAGYAPQTWPTGLGLDELGRTLVTSRDDAAYEQWTPGEAAARERLADFAARRLPTYDALRDRPDLDATSQLSPYLARGDVGIREVWAQVDDWLRSDHRSRSDGWGRNGDQNRNDARIQDDDRSRYGSRRDPADAFKRQLAWREFSYHVLYHHPETPECPLKTKFEGFAWVDDDELFDRWKSGRTGYPIVDAGMRQLFRSGWMHNRVRMIAASFLTKDLRLPWQSGARWFWETLVDADLANNTMGWQWSAGTGADAQPYVRVFNPVGQGRKLDPEGRYVRRWVPELADVPANHIHAPWEMSPDQLEAAGVELGTTYPCPVVDHKAARKAALAAYQSIN